MTGTTHDELVERLDKGAMVVTAKGADGIRATLLTCTDAWVTRPSRLWLR